MTCNTKEQMDSAIEFGKAINDIRSDQTSDTTIQFLDTSQALVSKIDGRYQTEDQTAQIKQSVTEKVGKKFKFFRKNPLLEQQGDIGNEVHDLNRHITEVILQTTKDLSNEGAYQYVKNLTTIPTEGLKKIYQS